MLVWTPHIARRVYVPRLRPSLIGYSQTKMTGILPVVEDLGFSVFVAARVAPLLARMNGHALHWPLVSDVSVPLPTDTTDHTVHATDNKRRRHVPGSSPTSTRYF